MKQFLGRCILQGFLFFHFTALFAVSTSADTTKTIVTSIQPLTLLVNELALPSDKVVQLVKNSNSAHHYQLKVSDRRLLQSADIVFWVGPELEIFLEKPLRQVGRTNPGAIATLSQLQNLDWPESAHKGHSHGDHHHSRDPHIWLSPVNVQVMVGEVARRLSELSPTNSEVYQKKAEMLIKRLTDLDIELKKQLVSSADKPFVVLHPAYTHFVERYGLRQIDYVGINPESPIGAKHLYQLGQHNLTCVFGEVGQNKQRIEKIARLSKASVGFLDPLGLNLTADFSIVDLIRGLADDLKACLE